MKKLMRMLGLLAVIHGLAACENGAKEVHASAAEVKVSAVLWGEANNQPIYLYTITNKDGMQVKVTNWGAYVQSIKVADKLGNIEDVLVGYNSWQEYYNDCCYSGPIVGRFGNRIANAQFEIDGNLYQVTKNDGGPNKDINQLHGGKQGLHKRVWQSKIINNGVELSYLSVDGEEGYPGNLNIRVRYTLNHNNEFAVAYEATTDKTTPVNLTLHTYFNLSGDRKRSIESHELTIAANQITPVDDLLIPTGALQDVANSPFDFTQGKLIGQDIRVTDPQLIKGGGMDKEFGGFDHNWVFSDYDGSLKKQVSLYDPQSGRLMEILTEEPAIQFYSGNFMDGSVLGKNAQPILHREGLALEPQHFPDSPNQPLFPSTLLEPGEVYQTQSVYRFSVK